VSFGPIQSIPCPSAFPSLAPAVPVAPAPPIPGPAPYTSVEPPDPTFGSRALFFNAANPPVASAPVAAAVVPLAQQVAAVPAPAPQGPTDAELAQLSIPRGPLFFNPDNLNEIQQRQAAFPAAQGPSAPAPAAAGGAAPGLPTPPNSDLDHDDIEQLFKAQQDAETAAARQNNANLLAILHQGAQQFSATINPGWQFGSPGFHYHPPHGAWSWDKKHHRFNRA
jgi:hypothetical protein